MEIKKMKMEIHWRPISEFDKTSNKTFLFMEDDDNIGYGWYADGRGHLKAGWYNDV
jgi:hypothetical protein